jgi:phage recombination protein Bet
MSNVTIRDRFELAGFEQAQIQLYKDNFCKGASDEELFFFMTVCKQSKLDPVKRQIFCVPRYDNKLKKNIYTPQTSVDGLRVLAERTGTYEGQTPPYWCGKDGVWKDVWLSNEHPEAAKVGVYKKGCREPIWGIARWDAYVQQYYKEGQWHTGPMWKKMGDTMLAKCAESMALRKACPDDTQGLYTKEEMEQTHSEEIEAKEIVSESRTAQQAIQGPSPDTQAQRGNNGHVSPVEGSTVAKTQATGPRGASVSSLNDRLQPKEATLAVTSSPKTKPEVIDVSTGEVQNNVVPFEDLEKPLTHWDRIATAGPNSGKTLKQIFTEVGKDDFVKMYQTSTAKIAKMNAEGKPISQNTLETYCDLEACCHEMGVQ